MAEDDAKLWKLEQDFLIFCLFVFPMGSCGTFFINKTLNTSLVNFALISTEIGCKQTDSISHSTI